MAALGSSSSAIRPGSDGESISRTCLEFSSNARVKREGMSDRPRVLADYKSPKHFHERICPSGIRNINTRFGTGPLTCL